MAKQAAFTIDGAAEPSSILAGEEAVIAARQTVDSLIIIVDQDDTDAVHNATKAGEASRNAGAYLVVVICSEPADWMHLDTTMQLAIQHSLCTSIDSLVVVKTGWVLDNDCAQVARVAYTLVAATLGHRMNLIALDLGDLKEALRGWVVAAVTRADLSDSKMTGATAVFDERIDLTPALAGSPRGLFCSYGAPPDQLRLEGFEATGAAIQEALRRDYPENDVMIVAACLADSSLNQASEVVTFLAFYG